MNTHVPGFQSFSGFLHHFVMTKLVISSIRVPLTALSLTSVRLKSSFTYSDKKVPSDFMANYQWREGGDFVVRRFSSLAITKVITTKNSASRTTDILWLDLCQPNIKN